jgi:hypothetical protein
VYPACEGKCTLLAAFRSARDAAGGKTVDQPLRTPKSPILNVFALMFWPDWYKIVPVEPYSFERT